MQPNDPIFADELTAQQIFDFVWTKFVVEGAPGAIERLPNGSTECRYQTSTGARCALGVLLTDSEIDAILAMPGMNGRGAARLMERGLMPDRLLPHRDLISALQHAHDCHGFGGQVREERLRDVANSFGLTIPAAS
jgi:hypothetical protein